MEVHLDVGENTAEEPFSTSTLSQRPRKQHVPNKYKLSAESVQPIEQLPPCISWHPYDRAMCLCSLWLFYAGCYSKTYLMMGFIFANAVLSPTTRTLFDVEFRLHPSYGGTTTKSPSGQSASTSSSLCSVSPGT